MYQSLKRILLVEDNDQDIELILKTLKDYNLANEVIVVNDCGEAMDYLHRKGKYAMRLKGNPIVIVLDIKVDNDSGLELVKHAKSDVDLKQIPVVILSACSDQKEIKQVYKNGANAYVVKPVEFHGFVNAVKELGVFWALVNEPPPRG